MKENGGGPVEECKEPGTDPIVRVLTPRHKMTPVPLTHLRDTHQRTGREGGLDWSTTHPWVGTSNGTGSGSISSTGI